MSGKSDTDTIPPGLAWLYEAPVPEPPNPKLDYALKYAGIGWPVIPCWWVEDGRCACGAPSCDSPGKHPIGRLVPHGLKEATTGTDIIRSWWRQYPNANIAVVTGETSGIVAVDIDTHKGGQAAFDQWVFENNIQLPETVTQQTGSGGLHYVFRYPAGLVVGNRTDILKGVDVRGQNGYIMVEPSCNLGGPYAWIDGEPWDSEIAELPQKLLELIGGKQKSESGAAPGVAGAKWIIPEETVQEVIDALRFIPADLYQRGTDPRSGREILGWIEIGHALKMMGLGERGFQIWDEWSQKSSKYDPSVMRSKWRSFGPTDITHLSIFKCAQDLGWQNPGAGSSGGAVSFNPETGEINPVDLARQYNAVMADAVMAPATVEIDLDQAPAVIEPDETRSDRAGRMPNELLRIPVPELQACADYFNSRTEKPVPILSVMGALALGSVLTGRIYKSVNDNRTALFFVAIAGSGIGKNYIKTEIRRILDVAGMDGLSRGSGYTSPGALYSTLLEAPTHITIIDELGNKLAEARRQRSGELQAVTELLKEAFSDCNGILEPKNYSTMGLTKKQRSEVEKKKIKAPSITLLGLSTPDQFFSEIKYSEVEGGLLNRFICVQVSDFKPKRQSISSQGPDESLIAWVKAVRHWGTQQMTAGDGVSMVGVDTGYDVDPTCITVAFDQDVVDFFRHVDDEVEAWGEKLVKERLDDMVRRSREKAMRVATMLAACRDPDEPVVTLDLAEWAWKYVRYHDARFIDSIRDKVYESEHENQQNIFLDAIMRAGRAGVTERDMNRNSPFKAQKLRDRQEIIATLAAGGLIKKAIIKQAGRPREAWVHFKYAPADTNE